MSDVIHLFSERSSLSPKADLGDTLPTIRAVAVSFLSTGRNAWHSVWIKRYNSGDFFRDGRSVRSAVSERKRPGTVFYMDVLPALQFDFGDRKFVMAEINTLQPFRHMDLEHARYALLGGGLDAFLDLVSPPSGLWKRTQPADDSIILQEIDEDLIDLAAYTALAKGHDQKLNPAIGSYKREIRNWEWGGSAWDWGPLNPEVRAHVISRRWYNQALEALMESRERLAHEHRSGAEL